MKTLLMKELTRWSCGLLLMVPVVALAAKDIDSTHEMPGDGLVQVENVAGGVEIKTWSRNEVQVRGRVADDVKEVEIESTSNGIRVVVRNKRNLRQIAPTFLDLKVPERANIEVETVSADLSVSGSQGDNINLETVSGDVQVEATSVRVDISSVSGDVEFAGKANRMTAESVSGEVVLTGVRDEVEASTVSGDITMESESVDNGRFETVSGEINLVLKLADSGRLDCDAMSGDINLRLPKDQEAFFVAQSYSGEINSEFGDPKRHSDSPSGEILKAKAGDNGARIRLETFSGDISIRAQ